MDLDTEPLNLSEQPVENEMIEENKQNCILSPAPPEIDMKIESSAEILSSNIRNGEPFLPLMHYFRNVEKLSYLERYELEFKDIDDYYLEKNEDDQSSRVIEFNKKGAVRFYIKDESDFATFERTIAEMHGNFTLHTHRIKKTAFQHECDKIFVRVDKEKLSNDLSCQMDRYADTLQVPAYLITKYIYERHFTPRKLAHLLNVPVDLVERQMTKLEKKGEVPNLVV